MVSYNMPVLEALPQWINKGASCIMEKQAHYQSPLRWWGGKKYQLKYILPLIPPHECYVEVFGGAGWVLFAKEPSGIEVYNDLDGRLVNFFLITKYHPECLAKEISTLFHSRSLFEMYQQQPGETCIQKAARFYFILKQSFGSGMRDFSYGRKKIGGGANWSSDSFKTAAAQLRERIKGICIEQLDFETLIYKYDSEGTFFYLDPPYNCPAGDMYKHKFSISDHHRLARVLREVKGKWLLSYNDSPFIRGKYRRHCIKTIINRVQTGPGKVGHHRELLIANYPLPNK